jgi:hypothetical protein
VNPAHLVAVTPKENTDASTHTAAHRNRRKTHCVHDHEFTIENTYLAASGSRQCKTCKNNRTNTRRRAAAAERGPVPHYQSRKSHCPNGHPYSGDNLYEHPDGSRKCRACMRANGTAYWERKRMA